MSSRVTKALFFSLSLFLFFCFTAPSAASRRLPAALPDASSSSSTAESSPSTHPYHHAAVGDCGGDGEPLEECLMRRTLEAHLDYIYTQDQQP